MANTDQAEGTIKKVVGKVKEKVGKLTGDEETEVHGKADQVEGTVQKGFGDVKDAL